MEKVLNVGMQVKQHRVSNLKPRFFHATTYAANDSLTSLCFKGYGKYNLSLVFFLQRLNVMYGFFRSLAAIVAPTTMANLTEGLVDTVSTARRPSP